HPIDEAACLQPAICVLQCQVIPIGTEPDTHDSSFRERWYYWSNGRLGALVGNERVVNSNLSCYRIKCGCLHKRRLHGISLITSAIRGISRDQLIRCRQSACT